MIKQFSNLFVNTRVLISLISFTIIFSFLDRSLSNVFLVITFIISIFLIRKNNLQNSKQLNKIAIVALLFPISIILLLIYHNSSISYFDNFSRILLLIPIMYSLIDVNLSISKIKKIIIFCSMAAVTNYVLFSEFDADLRYKGASSVAITYGNMLMLLVITSIFLLIKHNYKNKYLYTLLLISICINIFLWSETETRGSLLGLMFCLTFILFTLKKGIKILFFLIFILASVGLSNDTFIDRFDNLYSSLIEQDIGNKDSTNTNATINERILYYKFSYLQITENPLLGIGPQNFQVYLENYIDSKNLDVTARAHAHNEFLDIAVKYGLIPLFFFYYVCFYPIKLLYQKL